MAAIEHFNTIKVPASKCTALNAIVKMDKVSPIKDGNFSVFF